VLPCCRLSSGAMDRRGARIKTAAWQFARDERIPTFRRSGAMKLRCSDTGCLSLDTSCAITAADVGITEDTYKYD
jgi:hypothetical protein